MITWKPINTINTLGINWATSEKIIFIRLYYSFTTLAKILYLHFLNVMIVLSAQQNFIICDGVKSSQVRNVHIRNECYILWLGLKNYCEILLYQ